MAKVILDMKGLYTRMYYRGIDRDARPDADGNIVNSAAHGFINFIDEYFNEMIKVHSPWDIIACFEDGKNSYRTGLFPDYKKHRRQAETKKPRQEEVKEQLKALDSALKTFLAYMGVTCLHANGVEADDLMAAVCKGYKDTNKIIYSNDADLLQLSDEKTVVFNADGPVTDAWKTDDAAEPVPFDLIVLHKALVGDKSDGYIGVNRFGPKAWDHVAEAFGYDGLREIDQCFRTGDFSALEECYDITKDKALGQIITNLSDAKLCYQLARLAPEVCYQFHGNTLVWPKVYVRIPNRERVHAVLQGMECPGYIDAYDRFFPKERLVTRGNLDESVNHFLDHLDETEFFSFDYETVDRLKHAPFNEAMSIASRGENRQYVDVLSSEITGCSINYGSNHQYTVYLSVDHKDTDNVPKEVVKDFLETIEQSRKPLVAHNAGFEEQVTKLCLDLQLEEPFDTMIMASYVNEEDFHGLKDLSKQWLNYTQATYKEVLQGAGAEDMAGVSGAQVLSYGCDDSLVTARLCNVFETILRMEGQWQFYLESERAPVHLISMAHEKGVRIDFEEMERLAAISRGVIAEGERTLRDVLAKHCTQENEKAGKALDDADGKNLMQIDRATGKYSEDKLLARREERRLKWQRAAIYVPYAEKTEAPTFTGTHTQLNVVLSSMGVSDTAATRLKAVTRPQVNNLLTNLRLEPAWSRDARLREFAVRLAEAVPEMKKREGPAFADLAEFCLPYLGSGRTTAEGDELNLDSPNQTQEILYCKLGLPVRLRSKVQRKSIRDELGLDGSPATGKSAISLAIAEDCLGENEWKRPALEAIRDIKTHQKLFSMYFDTYPLWRHPRDGMIHPGVKNCGTVTRRPTGTNPNILQVKKGEVRTIYLPRYNDHVIVTADFNGQELRITGSEARDPVMIEAYTGGGTWTDEDGMVHPVMKDIHSVTGVGFAREIFIRAGLRDFLEELGDLDYDVFRQILKGKGGHGVKAEKAALLVRKYAKMVNFLIIYGGSASTLAMNLGLPQAFCEDIMRLVFITYPRLQPWQEETISFGRRNGYVRTAYGSLKHLTSDIRSKDGGLRSRQERQACNFTVQGTAADILKKVMTSAWRTRLYQETKAVPIAPVYDELVSSVPATNAFEFAFRLQQLMNITPPGHAIPMLAEVSIGASWGDTVELGDNPSQRKVEAAVEEVFKSRKAA